MKDSQFFNYLIGIIGGLAVFMIAIIVLANVLTDDTAQDKMVVDSIKKNIAPIGMVTTSDTKVKNSPAGAAVAIDADAIYKSACFACHGTGAAGAPKLGDKTAWKVRIAQGKSTLYKNAISGKGGMPPKGGQMQLSGATVKAVVDYMVSQSK